jgi:drug/metabolite transporter (DMT)-like permease
MARERAGKYWAVAALALAVGITAVISAGDGGTHGGCSSETIGCPGRPVEHSSGPTLPIGIALVLLAVLLAAVALPAGRPSFGPPTRWLVALLVVGGVLFVLFAFTLIGIAGEVWVLVAAMGLFVQGVSAVRRG